AAVGVALDAHAEDLRMGIEDDGDLVEQGEGAAIDGRAVGAEVDLLHDLEAALGDHDALLLLAAVVLDRARDVRAVVDAVDDGVTVAIGVGAAAVLDRAGLVRALVLLVGDAVAVVVRVRAAVGVL